MKALSKRNYKPKKENVTVSIRLPDSLKDELESLATEYGRGFSDFVQEGLDQWAAIHRNLEGNSATFKRGTRKE